MLEFLISISVIVSFALTIGFFLMFRNLAFIKYYYYPTTRELKENCNKSRYLGRDIEALHFLQEFVWASLKKNRSKKNYDSLKLEYNNDFLKFGSEFPLYPY
jgi:hypothetical protein